MATVVFPEINEANNAITTLNGSINDSTTSVVLATGGAAALGFSGATTDAYITVIDATTWRKNPLTSPETLEIMQVTAVSGDTLTVTRGVDGTSAIAFADGSIVELRINAAMIQRIYDALTDGTDDLKFNRAELGDGGAGVTHNNSALQIDETAGGLISAGCEANGNKSFWIADPDEPDAVQLQYGEATKAVRLGTKVAGGNMQFRTGDNVTALTIDSTQNVTIPTGDLEVTAGGLSLPAASATGFIGDGTTANSNADEFVISKTAVGNIGLSIMSNVSSDSAIYLGDQTTKGWARLINDGSANTFYINVNGTTTAMTFDSSANVSIDSGDLTVTAGEVFLNLPTSAGTSGSLYNDGGTVKVSP